MSDFSPVEFCDWLEMRGSHRLSAFNAGDAKGPVDSNVQRLLQKIKVTDRIDHSWAPPGPWR